MACSRSNDAVDGFNSLAVVISEGTGADDTAESKNQIDGIFPLTDLPIELQNKIIGHAMTAIGHQIVLPCLTNAAYMPNIAVGLLLANHRIYHEAHYQLRKQNTFYFTNFGSDLKTLASNVGPFKCRSGACGHGRLHSELANVVFELGDDELPNFAEDKVHAFGCVLRHLRSVIIIGSLHLKFAYHTFGTSAQLSVFASRLNRIKVQGKVTITGDERYLEMSFGDLPKSLGMDVMPVRSSFQAYNPQIQYSPGSFDYQYHAQKHLNKADAFDSFDYQYHAQKHLNKEDAFDSFDHQLNVQEFIDKEEAASKKRDLLDGYAADEGFDL